MTHRTEHQQTPIEQATRQVTDNLSRSITAAFVTFHPTKTETEFRQIIAGYFENKSLRDWCETLQIQKPEHAP